MPISIPITILLVQLVSICSPRFFGADAEAVVRLDEQQIARAVKLLLVPNTHAIDIEIVTELPANFKVANYTIVLHQRQSGLCPLPPSKISLVATIVSASNVHHVRGLVPNTVYQLTVYVDYFTANSSQQLRLKPPIVAETTTLSAAPAKPQIQLVNVTDDTAFLRITADCYSQNGNVSQLTWIVEHMDDPRIPIQTYFYDFRKSGDNGTSVRNETNANASLLTTAMPVTSPPVVDYNITLVVSTGKLYAGNRIRVRANAVNDSGSEGDMAESIFTTTGVIYPLQVKLKSSVQIKAKKVVSMFVPNQNGVKLTQLLLNYRLNDSNEQNSLVFSFPERAGIIRNYDLILRADVITQANSVFTAVVKSINGKLSVPSEPILIDEAGSVQFVFMVKNATNSGQMILEWEDDTTRNLEDPLTARLIYGVIGGGCLLVIILVSAYQGRKYRDRRRNDSICENSNSP